MLHPTAFKQTLENIQLICWERQHSSHCLTFHRTIRLPAELGLGMTLSNPSRVWVVQMYAALIVLFYEKCILKNIYLK
jgi:hypothetical protein